MIAYSHIRDEIVINDAFVTKLLAEASRRKLAVGATILLAARTIRHANGFVLRLDTYNLILAADEYDPAGGAIDLTGRPGTPGTQGTRGAAGTVNATGTNNKPGGKGGIGGSGGAAGPGNTLQIVCRSLRGAKFSSRGGAGGAAGAGGAGGDGGSGKRVVMGEQGGKITEKIGTDGGNGGNGGNGSAGGKGGQITVTYVESKVAPTMTVSGGVGGAAGAAGTGGKAGPESKPGLAGKVGAAGGQGAPGAATASAVSMAQFWQAVRMTLGPTMTVAWATYRLRSGDYAHRIAIGADTDLRIAQALADYRAVANIYPSLPGLAREQSLMAGHNPLGLRRDVYVVPDFTRYEGAFTSYAPLIQMMLADARDLLLHADNVGTNKQRLINERNHFQMQKAVIASELAEAQLEVTNATSAVAEIDTRISAVKAEIKAKEKELMEATAELDGEFIGTLLSVVVAVAAVAGACFTGGATLAALPGILIAAEGAWSRINKDASGELKYDDRPLADIIQWNGKDGKSGARLKPEIEAEIAGLAAVVKNGEKVVKATMDLIDKFKVLNDIGTMTIKGGPSEEHRALLKRSAQIHLERAQAQVSVEVAKIRRETVMLKDKQADADIAAAQQMIDTLVAGATTLGRACRMVVRRAQEYMDVLMRFHFLAARALEIFAYQDNSSLLNYALGWVDPDNEEDAYERLDRGDTSALLTLLQAYLTSWSKMPQLIALRGSYETYRHGLSTQSEFWTIEGPALDTFRATGSVEIEVSTEALLGDPRECKIEGTSAALIGATSAAPFVPCVLMHGGASMVRLLNGTEIAQVFAPRGAALQAAKTEAAITQVVPSPPEAFWGRSPATRWRLYVQPEALAQVNLAGVTKIVIGVAYKALNPALGVHAGGQNG